MTTEEAVSKAISRHLVQEISVDIQNLEIRLGVGVELDVDSLGRAVAERIQQRVVPPGVSPHGARNATVSTPSADTRREAG